MAETGTVRVLIPTPLRRYTGGSSTVESSGNSIADILDDLNVNYPGLKERVCEEDGEIRRFVNVFINGENVRKLDGAATPVKQGDEIGIIPAMAGGQ